MIFNIKNYPVYKITISSKNNQKKLSQTFEPTLFNLADFGKKQVEVRFSVEQTSHDGGLLLLNEVEKQIGLVDKLAKYINDPRHQAYVHHPIDFIVSCCYDRIFKPEILSLPDRMAINIHPSLLPKYRGVKPLENAIVQDETETGVSVHRLDKELDKGKILLQSGGIFLEPSSTFGNLYD